jgi:hypothetical protein
MQNLERHQPVVLQVARQIHRCHSPAPQGALEGVAVGESSSQIGRKLGHMARAEGDTILTMAQRLARGRTESAELARANLGPV